MLKHCGCELERLTRRTTKGTSTRSNSTDRDARCVTPLEALCRIYGFDMSERSPSVLSLHLHLLDMHMVSFSPPWGGFNEHVIIRALKNQCLQCTLRWTEQMKEPKVYCTQAFPSSICGTHRAKNGRGGYKINLFNTLEESSLPIQPRGSVAILGFF
jgi:hypothetical protein